MEEALAVNVEDGLCELARDVSDFPLFESLSLFLAFGHQFVEILLDVLEDEVGFVDYADDFLELDDVGVLHFAESLDFCELEALFPGAVLFFESFDGDYFSGLFVLSHFDVAERSRPQLL